MERCEVINYLPILKFLEIDCLLSKLREDVINNISEYDIFSLMEFAHNFNEDDIFNSCLKQLEKEGF